MIEQTPTIEQASQAPVAQPPQPAPAALQNNSALRRSPFLAAILSLMPGVGQVYLGYYQLGFVHAIVVCTLVALLAAGELGPLIPLASVFLAFFWLYNIVDAARRAIMVNEALEGRSNIELPEDFAAPGLRGTVVGGTIVIAVGLALLSRTLFGVSLEWLEEWWPAALVIFGAYLIFKAKGDQASKSAAAPEDD